MEIEVGDYVIASVGSGITDPKREIRGKVVNVYRVAGPGTPDTLVIRDKNSLFWYASRSNVKLDKDRG